MVNSVTENVFLTGLERNEAPLVIVIVEIPVCGVLTGG